ncbi:FTR1 family iron permease [Bacillus piscicola]|uniref:FTR1 family iron permease n=1 Tax=Bacillus piscicola TaxID=1632684 RepID=UPI001F09DC5D|nr:FTR1 family protein [Bacillus piscicola]
MKKVGIVLCFLLYFLSPLQFAAAEEDYQNLFISVGDAMMKTKAEDWQAVDGLVTQLQEDWKQVDKKDSSEAAKVDKALANIQQVLADHEKETMLDNLSAVSHALVAFEKEQNPVDEEAQRQEVKTALTPILEKMKTAIESENASEIESTYDQFLAAWNKKESIVRAQSIPHYGQIETQMGFLRMGLSQEEKDYTQIATIHQTLADAVASFLAGKEVKTDNQDYSLATLIDLLDKAEQDIGEQNPEAAVPVLQEFLTVWPSVEGEVRTKNGSLYTELESEIPVIAGKLSSSGTNMEEQKSQLSKYKQSLELLQEKTSYSVWDAALVMLREGLEALLIVAALIAFLRKANALEQQKWIWVGAAVGVLMSVAAAVVISKVFSLATAGANREAIEGVTGLVAVVMMLGVGVWLHQKSNMKAWNHYIQKQMGTALSTGSIVAMSFVSFLSIFREGAETIIFYAGMAPSISTAKLLLGILVAIGLLGIFAFLFIRYSTKIAIAPFFKIATVLIYLLAFKILGVSIHALQLTKHISTTQVQQLPIINAIGFFPTLETILPQLFLLLIVLLAAGWYKRTNKQLQVSESGSAN